MLRLFIVVPLLLLALAACDDSSRPKAKFIVGTMVKTKVGGFQAQIVWAGCNHYECWYDIRVASTEMKNGSTFQFIKRMENVREFELEVSQ